jgi:PAS domain S-box-containing protein
MAGRDATARRSRSSAQSLRKRLREAEDTLAAIRDGHVDAIVMQSPHGEQVFRLRTADEPYRLMVEQMREGAMTLSADGTILFCNRRLEILLGHPGAGVVGQAFSSFVAPEDVPKFEALLAAETFREECNLLVDGQTVPTQLSATALDIDGTRTTAVVVSDLTPERTEKALRESNRLKDEFLATLSHELRTPLNVILGWTRMLMSEQLSAAARRRALELVDKNAQAQAQIVADLVDMSRITNGKLSLDPLPLPIEPAIDSAIDSVRLTAEAKGVTIESSAEVADDLVLADATRLQQILWNLLSNALKFTPAGGRVQVRAFREDTCVRIEVADTGIGIDPRFLPHVFDRFRQAESGTTRGFGGLGLGLAVVKDLVRLHSGTVSVESDGAGRGATFTVRLPRAESLDLGHVGAPREVQERRLQGSVIVLIEDHEDSRELTAQVLEQAGARVLPYRTATEAYDALETSDVSAIIADIALPDEDGISFIGRVRRHESPVVRELPAVVLTAYTSVTEQEHALVAGFQRHIAKPADPDYLIDTLCDILERRL